MAKTIEYYNDYKGRKRKYLKEYLINIMILMIYMILSIV